MIFFLRFTWCVMKENKKRAVIIFNVDLIVYYLYLKILNLKRRLIVNIPTRRVRNIVCDSAITKHFEGLNLLFYVWPINLTRTKSMWTFKQWVLERNMISVANDFNSLPEYTCNPNARVEEYPFSDVRDCLFNIFTFTFHIWCHLFHPQQEDAPWYIIS
jgi:hypothetical protein